MAARMRAIKICGLLDCQLFGHDFEFALVWPTVFPQASNGTVGIPPTGPKITQPTTHPQPLIRLIKTGALF